MERNIWDAIVNFFRREIHSTYKVQAIGSFILGGGLGFFNYFHDIPHSLLQTWIGVWLWIKTIWWASSTSIITTLCSKLTTHYWDKHQKKSPPERKQKRA